MTVTRAYRRYEQERYLRAIREPIPARVLGSILRCDGGARDLRNHLMAQRAPDRWWEFDWLYRGIETPRWRERMKQPWRGVQFPGASR